MVYLDKERITGYKSDVLKAVERIEGIIALSEQEFFKEEKNIFSLRYLIILTVEAMADIGRHLLAKIAFKAVEEYRDCFREMGKEGFLSEHVSKNLIRLAGLRNLLVHRYWEIDDKRVLQECREGIKTVYNFLAEVDLILQKYPNTP